MGTVLLDCALVGWGCWQAAAVLSLCWGHPALGRGVERLESLFCHRLQEDTQGLFDKTGMEESNGNLTIHRDTILSEVCWDHVTITNL